MTSTKINVRALHANFSCNCPQTCKILKILRRSYKIHMCYSLMCLKFKSSCTIAMYLKCVFSLSEILLGSSTIRGICHCTLTSKRSMLLVSILFTTACSCMCKGNRHLISTYHGVSLCKCLIKTQFAHTLHF